MNQVEVLLPKPFGYGFDYRVPEGMALSPGDYVRVTFGRQSLVGVVWGPGRGDVPPEKIKPVAEHFSHLPPMTASMREFLAWVSRYTLAPLGMVLKMALPVEEAIDDSRKRKPALPEPEAVTAVMHKPLSGAQREAAEVLTTKLGKGFSVTVLDGVTGSGKTEVYFDVIEKVLGGAALSSTRHEARRPVPSVSSRFDLAGSGESGSCSSQVLVLLPEIALSTQWVERCKARFGFAPVVWHSGLTPARRRDALRQIITGEAKLVVGARSALFLPYRHLSLIVVDEEHEPSYKQEDGVFYHARDMAVARGHVQGVPVLLVSATPSMETVQNIRQGRYTALHLPERHGGVHLPVVEAVDMREEPPERGAWLSQRLRTGIADTLAMGRQVMLFLNRRGYAPLLLCRGCGYRFACPHCSSWMVVHGGGAQAARSEDARDFDLRSSGAQPSRDTSRGGHLALRAAPGVHKEDGDKNGRQESPGAISPRSGSPYDLQQANHGANKKLSLQCHHCDHREPVPKTCPSCAREDTLVPCGPGVERVAEEVRGLFPSAHVEVMTSDTMDSLKTAGETVSAMTEGRIDILVGTQMMAKGYHFPLLHLIGVVDADLGLQGGDLRAGERTYQLLHQVAGRAGRERDQGRVLLQTYLPDHPVMRALAVHDRAALEELELTAREDAAMPPFGRLAAVIVDGAVEAEVVRACRELARHIPLRQEIRVLGPASAPLARLRGRYRYRFLVRAPRHAALQSYIHEWMGQVALPSSVRVRVDIDPYSFF